MAQIVDVIEQNSGERARLLTEGHGLGASVTDGPTTLRPADETLGHLPPACDMAGGFGQSSAPPAAFQRVTDCRSRRGHPMQRTQLVAVRIAKVSQE